MPILLAYVVVGGPIVAGTVHDVVPLDFVSDGAALAGLVLLVIVLYGRPRKHVGY